MQVNDQSKQRSKMIDRQLIGRGICDQRVLDAMRKVPREAFLPDDLHAYAYHDTPLPIGGNQTISQPYIVAYMIEALGLVDGQRVLEIGTGSGYVAAILAEIADEVFTVERIQILAENAFKTLRSLNYTNVHVLHADGTLGWPEHAPFDAIIVSAGGPKVPDVLKSQLKVGGRLVIPVGTTGSQELMRIVRVTNQHFEQQKIAGVRFVPLIGEHGWEIDAEATRQADCLSPPAIAESELTED